MTRRGGRAAVAAVLVLSACAPTPPASPSPTPPSVSPTSEPPTPTPTPTPTPEPSLPIRFPAGDSLLDGGAQRVVAKLNQITGKLPALKLDITTAQVTLTVLRPDETLRTYRWRDGVIEEVDSDVRFVGQATFTPTDYPLGDLRRLFDVAELMGASGDQVLQVQEYRGQVYLTVTTRPESRTIFFRRDGSAIRGLGTSSVADITDGLRDVTDGVDEVLAVGFNQEAGYWADIPVRPGVIERRSRLGNLPAIASQRSDQSDLAPFDPTVVDPAAVAKAIAAFRSSATQECAVEIDHRHQRAMPVVRYDCGGTIHYSDLEGRDMTDLIG